MNILILGNGGREHAFAWKIAQSPLVDRLYIAPGNAGTAQEGENVAIDVNDFAAIKAFVLDKVVGIVVVGPEQPLVDGIVDFFINDASLRDIVVVGPKKDGAQLEGSKDFSKVFMEKYGIPTAKYQTFTEDTIEEGVDFLKTLSPPYVLKADGLAAGKGVLILDTLEAAENGLREMLVEKQFGHASSRVVVEEFLSGIELSAFVLTDGKSYKILPSAKDYKRIGVGDKGLNTGGMGAISPVPFADADFLKKVEEQIVKPSIDGLQKEGIDYRGFLFIGLMNVGGNPYVIEYNVRMGDPETEVVLPRIKSDIVPLFSSFRNQTLNQEKMEIASQTCATVIMVSGGYPKAYQRGYRIEGLDEIKEGIVFHAGTKFQEDYVVTSGGRVLAVTSISSSREEALNISFDNCKKICYTDSYYRNDIGFDLKKQEI